MPMRIHTLRKRGQDRPSTELLRRNFFPTLRRSRLQGCQLTDSKHWRRRRYVPSKRRKAITWTHSATDLQYWFPNTRTGLQLCLSALCPFPQAVPASVQHDKGTDKPYLVSPLPPLSCLLHNPWGNMAVLRPHYLVNGTLWRRVGTVFSLSLYHTHDSSDKIWQGTFCIPRFLTKMKCATHTVYKVVIFGRKDTVFFNWERKSFLQIQWYGVAILAIPKNEPLLHRHFRQFRHFYTTVFQTGLVNSLKRTVNRLPVWPTASATFTGIGTDKTCRLLRIHLRSGSRKQLARACFVTNTGMRRTTTFRSTTDRI